ASIGEDLPKRGLHLVQHHDDAGRMNDLERFRQQIAVGNSVRETVQRRVEGTRLAMLAEKLRACRRERSLFRLEIGENVSEISRIGRLTQSEERARRAGLA